MWSLHSPPNHYQPQANRGRHCVPAAAAPRKAVFLYFSFISKKENLILVPTNTDTLLFLSLFQPQHIPHPCPALNILHFLSLHVPPTLILPPTYTLHMPFSIPPCGHLNCPCWGVGSISIFTPSPPCFHLGRQCHASFICRAGWPIFSVWPHAAIVHRCSALSCCSCTGPRQQLWVWQPGWIRMGTAGTGWLPFKAIYLGCLEHHEFQNQNDKTKPYCTVKETRVVEWAHTSGVINISKFNCLGRVALLDTQCYWI